MTHTDHRQHHPSHTQNPKEVSPKKPLVKAVTPVSWTDRFEGREEPALREMIEDPIMTCLLASDGLTADSVLEIVNNLKARQNAQSSTMVGA